MLELIISVTLCVGIIIGFLIGQRVASAAMALGLFILGWSFGAAGLKFRDAWRRFRNILEG